MISPQNRYRAPELTTTDIEYDVLNRNKRPVLPRDWIDEATCKGYDPNIFFPESEMKKEEVEYPLSICARCKVRGPCLAYAIMAGWRNGIWGGTTGRQREKYRVAVRRWTLCQVCDTLFWRDGYTNTCRFCSSRRDITRR